MDSKKYSNFKGIVTQATGSWYDVLHEGKTHKCRIRGRLRLKGARSTSPVVVGDTVSCEAEDETCETFVICGVEPRRNYIIRRASNLSKESHIIGANIDRALVVVTLFSPETPTEFIDRFLITCEAYKVPATILLAKIDLARGEQPEAVEEFSAVYRSAGYEVVEVSATQGIGLDRVREILFGHTTLISGNSGVGKSTLIKAIEPDLDIRIGEISSSHNKGKHTTTFSTMYPLTHGGYIIDTPGIKGFGLLDIDDDELWHYYPEMMKYGAECQFYNCTHTHEPKCAVRDAVERGEIAYSRYESYLKILDEDDKYRK
ncbi:MAG: ribosome small subunit-dependent GTPase A [Rikenellaceae bacterium]